MLYIAYNGVMQTTAAFGTVSTSTGTKTLLQVATPAGQGIRVRSWGISFDGSAAAAAIKCELIDSNITGGTPTTATIQQYDAEAVAGGGTSVCTASTVASEGTITATRNADLQYVPPSGGYYREWALGKEFQVAASRFLRVRINAQAAVNVVTYVVWEE